MQRKQPDSHRVHAHARLLTSDKIARAQNLCLRAAFVSAVLSLFFLAACLYCDAHDFRRWWFSHAAAAFFGAAIAFGFAMLLIEYACKRDPPPDLP